jgi:hypothetical protein
MYVFMLKNFSTNILKDTSGVGIAKFVEAAMAAQTQVHGYTLASKGKSC